MAVQNAPGKSLIRLRERAGWSESSLGAVVRRYRFLRYGSIDAFLLFYENFLLYSLQAPRRDNSNEYLQHMFLWRNKNKRNIYWDTPPT